jgi:hypothetical protein
MLVRSAVVLAVALPSSPSCWRNQALSITPRSCSTSDSCAEGWELRCDRGDTSGQISTLQTAAGPA